MWMWKRISIEDKETIEWIYKKSKGQMWNLTWLMIGDVLFSLAVLLFSFATSTAIDQIVYDGDTRFFFYGSILLGIAVAQLVLRFAIGYGEECIRNRLTLHYRHQFLDEVLSKKYNQISKYHSGELLTHLFSDISVIASGVSGILPRLVSIVSRLILALGALFIFDKRLAVIFLVCGIVVATTSGLFRKRMKQMHRDVQEKEARMRSRLQETVEKLLIIRIFQKETELQNSNLALQEEHCMAQMVRKKFSTAASAGFIFVFKCSYVFALIWGTVNIAMGNMTYGSLVAILQLVGIIQAPFNSLSGILPQFYGMISSAERVILIEELESEFIDVAEQTENDHTASFATTSTTPSTEANSLRQGELEAIHLRHITFSYGNDNILENVSGTMKAGDTIAITGTSGCGKSTLFLLMLGIYELQEGTITFAMGNQILEPGRDARRLFSYVPQGNALFSGTIRENICFMNERTDEEIQRALELACVDEFIQSLPNGLDTVIGENALGVSEGQAQRLAIARAFIERAPILLLDEATSALDAETEERILHHIKGLEYQICLFVTHRRTVLDICNKEWVMTVEGMTEIEKESV